MRSEQGVGPEFVVEVDREQITHGRTKWLRLMTFSAWCAAIGAAVTIGASLILVGTVGTPVYRWFLLGGLFAAVSGSYFAAVRRRRKLWATRDIPGVAMRLSTEGVLFNVESTQTSVFLPWLSLSGVRVMRKRNQSLLILELAPSTSGCTPGVLGFDHPNLQRIVHSRKPKERILWAPVRPLRQSLEAIDAAFAHFTSGRIRVR